MGVTLQEIGKRLCVPSNFLFLSLVSELPIAAKKKIRKQ